MVWGLFPVDPLPGDKSYYFITRGAYKVGRKGCDIIVNKDKGVSRVHAEIKISALLSMKKISSIKSSKVTIIDWSKYGTFIMKPLGSKEKVNPFPFDQTTLDDGDLVSFGTGNATYRFSYIPLKFLLWWLEPGSLEEHKKLISCIGASATENWSPKCTHVVVDEWATVNDNVVNSIIAKIPIVSPQWLELLVYAEKGIHTKIPSCNSYGPMVMLQDVWVQVADLESRENCLSEYTFLLESSDKYEAREKLQTLLETYGAKVVPVGEFIPHSQGLEEDENNNVVHVISNGEGDGSESSHNLNSLPKVKEINVICATLSGRLNPAVFILPHGKKETHRDDPGPFIIVSPRILVASTCSTDETVVADSDPEVEITSVHTSIRKIESLVEDEKGNIAVRSVESVENESKVETYVHSISPTKLDNKRITATDDTKTKSKEDNINIIRLNDKDDGISTREHKIDDAQSGNSDIIFSQDLIVRDTNLLSSVSSPLKSQVLNFKQFKKMGTQSGNSFYNLIPFSKHPYKGSEYENEGVVESLKEEKKRKQIEAVADDLFNTEKAKRRGAAGFVQGLFSRR